jgi:MEMO1 family protein
MNIIIYRTWLITCFLLALPACNGQMKTEENTSELIPDRKPAVAGSFYPAQAEALKDILREAFAHAVQKKAESEVLAIIVPHAGYVYSAKIAASAFNQIDTEKKYDHIFIIGSSHRMSFHGASVYAGGHFITPLGKVPVDTLAKILAKEQGFSTNLAPHANEHSLEVQIPFLQYVLKKDFSIIPILLGTENQETCRKIAAVLAPYFNDHNLFVISTDLSHYPNYQGSQKSDNAITKAITTNSATEFLQIKNKVENEGIPNLLTALCGWTSVLTLLNITDNRNDIKIQKIDSQNSGDVSIGDKTRVVGYAALAVEKTKLSDTPDSFKLTEADKANLLHIARESLKAFVEDGKIFEPEKSSIGKTLQQQAGAFVTLTKADELRGCIGTFKPSGPVYQMVREMTISAASKDYRFSPVQREELDQIDIEISVLTPLRKIQSINEIEIGKHGIYIIKDNKSGTLLPQVPLKYGWTREEFLGYCARDKAEIGWNGWKKADIYIYEAITFSEKEIKDAPVKSQ